MVGAMAEAPTNKDSDQSNDTDDRQGELPRARVCRWVAPLVGARPDLLPLCVVQLPQL